MSKNMPAVFFTYGMSFLLFASSSNWFFLWVYMEINSLMFLSILSVNKTPRQSDSSQTYFLIQSVSSLIFLFGIYNSENTSWTDWNSPLNVIAIALMMKMAAAPLHAWLPPALMPSNSLALGLALTFQKMMPFILIISMKTPFLVMILISIIMSSSLGPCLNWNQINVKLILIYSSISHTGWMLAASMLSQPVWMIYFTSYSLLSMLIAKLTAPHLSKSFLGKMKNNNYMVAFLFMSLAGLPPLLGFFPKMMTLTAMLEQNLIALILLLLLSATADFFIYSRISFMSLMTEKENLMWSKPNTSQYPVIFLFSIFLFSFMIISS